MGDGGVRPPVAARKPFEVRSPHGTRVDDYYWLRDDTRSKPEVLDYLRAENAYREAVTARRFRPLARRRARTCRPFLVAMRTRNPWVRFRCRRFG